MFWMRQKQPSKSVLPRQEFLYSYFSKFFTISVEQICRTFYLTTSAINTRDDPL